MTLDNYDGIHFQFQNEQQTPPTNNDIEYVDIEQLIELAGGSHLYQMMFSIVITLIWMIQSVTFLSPPIIYQHVHLKCYDSKTNSYYQCTENNGGCEQQTIQVYDNTYNTMTSQFELYCDRKYIRQFALISVYMAGIIGSLFLSYLADNHGRKKILFISQFICTVMAILIPFINNVYFQIVDLFLIESCVCSSGIIHLSFINESSSSKIRSTIIMSAFLIFPIGSINFTYLFGTLRDWQLTFVIVITLPSLICCSQFFFLQETPLYLYQQKKEKELFKVIQKIASINGRSQFIKAHYKVRFLEKEKEEQPDKQKEEQSGNNYSDLFKYAKLRTVMISCMVLQFSNQITYIGVNFCLEDIGLDIYTNTIVVQLGQMIGQLIAVVLGNNVRRKKTVTVSFLFTFLMNFIQVFIRNAENKYTNYIQILLAFMAKLIGSICQSILYVYYPELFPTNIKNQASALITSVGFISITFVPTIVEFSNRIEQSALFMLSFMSLVAFLFAFLLVETLNRPLVHTIEQFEAQDDKLSENE